ncbi:MAG: AsmA family protein [Alphaproteobacteria bacterium]|nr:MAG: AsmA family protein [Alphaproteobacteria bacterium]
MGKIIAWTFGILGLAAGGAVLFVATFDINSHREELARYASQAMGRKVTLAGPLHLAFDQGLAVQIQDARIANTAGEGGDDLIRVQDISLRMAVAPLFQGMVQIDQIRLTGAQIHLKAGGKGAGILAAAPAAATSPKPSIASGPAGEAVKLQLHRILVRDSAVTYQGKPGTKPINVTIESADWIQKEGVAASVSAILAVEGTGKLDIEVQIPQGPLADPMPISAKVAVVGADTTLSATGKLSLKAQTLNLVGLNIDSKGNKLTGDLDIAWSGEKPSLRGALSSQNLRPQDLLVVMAPVAAGGGAASQKTPAPSGDDQGRMFSNATLPLAALGDAPANVDLDFDLARLESGDQQLSNIRAKLRWQGGQISLDPLSFTHAGSAYTGRVTAQGGGDPSASLRLKSDNLDLEALSKALGQTPPAVRAMAHLDMDLQGRGVSLHQLAQTAQGSISLVVDQGTVIVKEAGPAVSSLLAALAPGQNFTGPQDLRCLVARADLQQGNAQIKALLAKTPQVTLAGSGVVRLGDEKINLVVSPRFDGNDALNKLAVSVNVSGPLAKPYVEPDPKGLAQKAIGAFLSGGLGPTSGRVPLVADTRGADGRNPCVVALENPQYPAMPSLTREDVKGVLQKGKDLLQKLGL